ncbi:MAG: hypothetical protein K5656_07470 [Lachnospiraceae bacterium]|nr:hypothetical protein [Lachnospiraceae bacterium]
MDTIGLKVISYDSIAKGISILRKYNHKSMAEIKSDIEQGKTVFEQDYFNHSGVRKVRKCYDELTAVGITCEIYDEDEEVISRELISNLIDSQRNIEKEVLAQTDEETQNIR